MLVQKYSRPTASYPLTIFVSVLKDDEFTEDSESDVDVKKRGGRHKLLRHKLSLSEGESGDSSKEKKSKGSKKKSSRKGRFWLLLTGLSNWETSKWLCCVAINQLAATTLKTQTLRSQRLVLPRGWARRSVTQRWTASVERPGEKVGSCSSNYLLSVDQTCFLTLKEKKNPMVPLFISVDQQRRKKMRIRGATSSRKRSDVESKFRTTPQAIMRRYFKCSLIKFLISGRITLWWRQTRPKFTSQVMQSF